MISVLMGVHNGEKTLARAIDSIVGQTHDDWELIICNDASSDGTEDIVKKHQESYPNKIFYLKNNSNMGLAYSLNRCLDASHGEYIARMDDDDIAHLDRFEKQVSFLESNKEYAIVGSRICLFDEKGRWGEQGIPGNITKVNVIALRAFSHPTVMIRTEALKAVGGYTVSPLTIRSQDFDLWCKMYCAGYQGYNLDDILLDYYEKRDKVKEVVFKYKFNLFKMTMYWRRKMKLPFWYDIYAYKAMAKLLVPKKLLILYMKNRTKG